MTNQAMFRAVVGALVRYMVSEEVVGSVTTPSTLTPDAWPWGVASTRLEVVSATPVTVTDELVAETVARPLREKAGSRASGRRERGRDDSVLDMD